MDHTVDPYTQDCKSKVVTYLESATRFGGQALTFTRETADTVDVQVSIKHTFATAVSTEELVGSHALSGSDLGFNSALDYLSGLEAAQRDELAGPDNLGLVESQLPKLTYSQAAQGLSLRLHPRRLVHVYKCPGCLGKGEHACKVCEGKGKEGCPECKAKGALECGKCGGAGKTKCSSCGGGGKAKCPKCRGSRTMANPGRHDDFYASNTVSCDYCSGSGHIRCSKCTGLFSFRSGKVKCKGCKGKGAHTCKTCKGKRQVTCRTCDGHGAHKCHDCEGQGHFTSISGVTLVTEPTLSLTFDEAASEPWRSVLGGASAAELGQFGTAQHIDTEVDRASNSVTLRYSIRIPVCELETRINEEPSTWLLVGEKPEIKGGSVALENLLASDLSQLTVLADLNPYSFSYKSRAGLVIKLILDSEINQQLVENLRLPPEPEQASGELDFEYDRLTKSVSNVVSENYVSAMVYSLWTVCEGAAVSAVVRAGLLAAVLAPVVLFMLVAGFVQAWGLEVPEGASRLMVFSAESGFQLGVALAVGALTAWGGANLALMLHQGWLRRRAGKKRWDVLRDALDVTGVLTAKVLVMALGAASAWAWYRVFPLWVDLDGKYYGAVASMASLVQL